MMKKNRILVAEDDYYLQRDLKELLTGQGYEVVSASSKQEAMQYILSDKNISLYLLDVWFDDGEGFALCEQIRKQSINPVLFLTACDQEEYVVRGLNMGADDYIVKPFRVSELLSRIRANLRRMNYARGQRILVSKELTLNPFQCEVTLSGRVLSLSPTEYKLLYILMKNAGILLKREQLLELLCAELADPVENNTLSVQVSRLRSKIGAEYIETVWGFGYRFLPSVTEVIRSSQSVENLSYHAGCGNGTEKLFSPV